MCIYCQLTWLIFFQTILLLKLVDLVYFINSLPDYFTTSSCSGRISLYYEDRVNCKGVNWLLVKHSVVGFDEVNNILRENQSNVYTIQS